MEVTILFVAVAALILLAVTSMRYGVDSRDGFASTEHELAARGIARSGALATREHQKAPTARLTMSLPVPEQEPVKPCVPAPCGA
jgi:hypothetical protein